MRDLAGPLVEPPIDVRIAERGQRAGVDREAIERVELGGHDPIELAGVDRQLAEQRHRAIARTAPAEPGGAHQRHHRRRGLMVEGRVEARDGRGVAGLRVDVFLAPVGRGGADGTPIGRGVSNPDGSFSIDAVVPADLDLATYELFVSTRGDARYNPAYSDE